MPTRRQWITAGSLAALGLAGGLAGRALWRQKYPAPVPLGMALDEALLARARALLQRHPAVDAHAHPGRSFVRGAEGLSGLVWLYAALGPFEDHTLAEMRSGGLAASAFAAVADFQVLGIQDGILRPVRAFQPGEALASYRRQIGHLQALAQRGAVRLLQAGAGIAAELAAVRAAGQLGMLITVEGGDFLEGDAARVAMAQADGVRAITLLHYRPNELGDTITGAPVHGGLTRAGVDVVRAMNEAGLLVDVAHASEATARGVLKASRVPVIASHIHIHDEQAAHPRFISRGLARAITGEGGGVVGAWPAGIGISDLKGFVDRTLALVEAVGLDHVCLGSDMDANFQPVLETYNRLPHYVAGLLQQGLREEQVAQLIGGNFIRLLQQAARG